MLFVSGGDGAEVFQLVIPTALPIDLCPLP